MRVEIFKTQVKGTTQWGWRFRQRNGQIVSSAELFASKGNALRSAKACIRSIIRRTSSLDVLFSEPRPVTPDSDVLAVYWN